MTATHEVFNQATVLCDYSLLDANPALLESVRRQTPTAEDAARSWGKRVGSQEVLGWAIEANRNPPVLRTHDRFGHRLDIVEFHPAYHELMALSFGRGLHSLPWSKTAPTGTGQQTRAVLNLMMGEIEAGHGCPVTMTFASVPALEKQADVAREWVPKIIAQDYDRRFLPAAQKRGLSIGMGMTEKQGGSDVRANTTRAVAIGQAGPGGEYLLTGHKWFCSAPMCDAFLMLAQSERGLSCFLVPRFLPDGTQNRILLQRLKDKLGNRSNASSEIELDGTYARMIGEEGRGVPTIVEMVNHTRFDCVLGSTALIHHAVSQAADHVGARAAFGKKLFDQPLMRAVIADLEVESEAATLLAMRLAHAYDHPEQAAFRRIATAIGKFWVCKRAVTTVFEALECLGGAGYVEESVLPRLHRESPLNSVWEGSGNVICLDVLRAMAKEPETVVALQQELGAAKGQHRAYDHWLSTIEKELTQPAEWEVGARRLVSRLALGLQASLLLRHGQPAVAAAFCASRLGDGVNQLGALPSGLDIGAIAERARPRG